MGHYKHVHDIVFMLCSHILLWPVTVLVHLLFIEVTVALVQFLIKVHS